MHTMTKQEEDEGAHAWHMHVMSQRTMEGGLGIYIGVNTFFKTIKPRDHVGGDIVFPQNKVYIRVKLLNCSIQLSPQMTWSGVVLFVVMLRGLV